MRLRFATLATVGLTLGVVGALGVVRADPPAAESRPRLTLNHCIAHAERSYPGLAAQRHKLAAAQAQLSEAWVAPFLNFNVTGALAIAPFARGNATFSPDAFAQNPFDTGYEPFVRVSVETGVPLSPWTWWRIGQARDAARAGVRASEEEITKARLELQGLVRKAFFSLQLARDSMYLVDRALGYLDTAERQFEALRSTDGGTVSSNDLHQLRASRYEALARRSEAVRGESLARMTLGLLTGLGDQIEIVDEPLCPYVTELHPLVHYLVEARLRRPEVQMIAAGVAARRAAVGVQWGALFPDVALGLSAAVSDAPSVTNQLNPFAGNNANFAYWGGALVLRWNFEPIATAYRIRRARAELAMTESQQRLALGAIAVEVAEVHGRATDAANREHLWGLAERENYEWFTAVFQEYQAGTGEVSAIIGPLRQYLQARASHLQATYDLNVALAQLSQAIGREAMLGAPRAECLRPPTGPEPDDADAGIDEAELQRLLQSTQGEEDAAVATPSATRDAAIGPDARRGRPLRR